MIMFDAVRAVLTEEYVEFKDATGQRTDAFGNPITRKSPDNHTSIDFDL